MKQHLEIPMIQYVMQEQQMDDLNRINAITEISIDGNTLTPAKNVTFLIIEFEQSITGMRTLTVGINQTFTCSQNFLGWGDFEVKNYCGDCQARNAIELDDFGSIQLMHTVSGNELYFLMSEGSFLNILDKVWKHVNFSERAINVNAIVVEKKSQLFIDFKTKQSNVLNRDELVSIKIYVSPNALNDRDAAESFNLKVQSLTKTISLTISDVARFVDMNILVSGSEL
ncbi:MAG: hypothetical protein EZS28_008457 [Streblomastix strix]|uniref:Uncharacterized protein n=1 Tax=Streblomastix strix TaxID=222440 RepID=A0A5J4WMK6_9EUKA|nr:MAG: hypothetical protein EZS28_008457 [Streblomastix strix]